MTRNLYVVHKLIDVSQKIVTFQDKVHLTSL